MSHFANRFRVTILAVVAISCCGWGFLVHRSLAQLAVYQLPKKMRPFFYTNIDYLVKQSVRPDLRRSSDPGENAKHFIDLEKYGDSAAWKMPLHWNDAVTRYSKDSLLVNGYVPYVVMMVKDSLTNAFRRGNKDSILFYATDLGHYIGDAHVPLHTTSNYDGQLSNQKGLHNLWESIVPEIELGNYKLYNNHQASYLSKPDEAIWTAVRNAHSLLARLFEEEKEASKGFTDSTKYHVQVRKGKTVQSYSAAFAKVYSDRLGNSINAQLLAASNLIADFWYTSWVDAGRPDLSILLATPFVKTDKKRLKTECKAYRKETLQQKGLLRAKAAAYASGTY